MTTEKPVTAVINGETFKAKIGQTLLHVARRNSAHIGFVCDGRGYCATCECKILQGAELLNPPSRMEIAWVHPNRLAKGYRLGCQAVLENPGEIKLETRVEILKKQFLASFDRNSDPFRNIRIFFGNLTLITIEYLERTPPGISNTLKQVGPYRTLFPWRNSLRVVRDTNRIINKQLGNAGPVDKEHTGPKVIEVEEIDEFKDVVEIFGNIIKDVAAMDDSVMLTMSTIQAAKRREIPPASEIPPAKQPDFVDILDIGPVFNQRLLDAGVKTFEQLASMSPEKIAEICNIQPERVIRNHWREQAAQFAEALKKKNQSS